MATIQTERDGFFRLRDDSAGLVQPGARPPWWVVSLAALAGVSALVVGGFLGARFQCSPAADWVEVITSQEQAGHWRTASGNARSALTKPRLCQSDRAVLVQKVTADGLEALYAEAPHPADAVAQRRLVDEYDSITDFAAQHQVRLASTHQVAGRAYRVEAFLLAKHVWEQGFQSTEVSSSDRSALRGYANALRNLGRWWAEQGSSPAQREEGFTFLATCAQVVERYALRMGECHDDLTRLVGPDRLRWPSPVASPLLSDPDQFSESATP